VVAVAQYSDDKYYLPIPLVASPSDKIEKADDLARWMRIVLDVWKSHNLERRPMVLYGLLLVMGIQHIVQPSSKYAWRRSLRPIHMLAKF